MGKLDKYIVDLKGLQQNVTQIEYVLDNQFFADLDAPEVEKGRVTVCLTIKKFSNAFELMFQTEGVVVVLCDRCLDEMEQAIASEDKFTVKFGAKYDDENDDLIVIPEDEGTLNVAWFMYEFIALAIPMKHVHPSGKCNNLVSKKLGKLLRTSSDDEEMSDDFIADVDDSTLEEEEKPIDPRWNELKKIFDNN
ncbi:MAG: DUF177 domain-containing protein [Bacteroides sp.]|nr:DUF177 domain-containing protein [Bacteroides sp.]